MNINSVIQYGDIIKDDVDVDDVNDDGDDDDDDGDGNDVKCLSTIKISLKDVINHFICMNTFCTVLGFTTNITTTTTTTSTINNIY
ncbi:unnamed protein product [Schistosoma mattheei]|uniref:Uncharacterized protein n=1 Tax=Schistosoma mattheei TaxID=31246 RepID=A0A183NXR3_9TREM|nr:unnamed protein product [Schistosoma mattheei]